MACTTAPRCSFRLHHCTAVQFWVAPRHRGAEAGGGVELVNFYKVLGQRAVGGWLWAVELAVFSVHRVHRDCTATFWCRGASMQIRHKVHRTAPPVYRRWCSGALLVAVQRCGFRLNPESFTHSLEGLDKWVSC